MEQFITEAKCRHNLIGQGMITHGGISHPGGPQKCLECNMTLEDILSQAYTLGKEEGKRETMDALFSPLTNPKTEELDPSKGGGGGH